MAMSSGGGQGGRPGMMSEINVTPLVDVMLVLLIIFMVTAPMMTQGLDVELPKVDAQALQTEEEQTVLTVRVDGAVFLDEHEVTGANLAFQVAQVMQTKGSKTVFLKADQNAAYGSVAQVMSQLRQAGITSIGLVTEPADRAAPAVSLRGSAG
jgi:biopolymer transport protein TolR